MTRAAINAFELANPLYKNATVSFYTVANGVKTATLATLYSGVTGATQLANPQKLNSRGQFKQAVYIDAQVIGEVEGISVPGHDTSIYSPAPTFRVQQSTGKLQYSYDGGVTYSDTGDTIFLNRGAWVTATNYNRNDLVSNGGYLYVCLVAHTAGTFATDLAALKWVAIAMPDLTVSGGSALVGFIQSGANAKTRTSQSRLRDRISALDYIDNDVIPHSTILDGTNTTDLQPFLALACSEHPGAIIELTGTDTAIYKLNGPLDLGSAHLDFGVATIDASEATGLYPTGLIYSSGSIGAAVGTSLTGSISKGYAGAVSFTAAHNLSIGDLCILRDPADGSFNAARAYYRKGEFLTVKSVGSPTQVTFATPTLDSYPATGEVYKVEPTHCSIFGSGKIIGNPADVDNTPIIKITYGAFNKIHAPTMDPIPSGGIELNCCYHGRVYFKETTKFTADSGAVQSWGLVMSGMHNISTGGVLFSDRHGASLCGGGAGYVCDRFNEIQDAHVIGRANYAADFHGGGEYNYYRRCKIFGGVNLAGIRNDVVDCDIWTSSNNVALVHLDTEAIGAQFTLRNNTYHKTSSAYVIDASSGFTSNFTQDGTFLVEGGEVIDEIALNSTYFNFATNGSLMESKVHIKGTTFKKTDTTKYGYIYGIAASSGNKFAEFRIENVITEGVGLCVTPGTNITRYVERNNTIQPNASTTVGQATADELQVNGSSYFGGTPTFIGPFLPSDFMFERTVSLAVAAKSFAVYATPTGNQFMPTMAQARADTDITATNGEYWGLGYALNNRRTDYGVCATAAAANKHSKNAKLNWQFNSVQASQPVASGEGVYIISVADTTDAAALANNIGGAGETITVRIAGRLIGDIVDAA